MKKEVARWLNEDNPTNDIQRDGNQIDRSRSGIDCLGPDTLDRSSADEAADFMLAKELPTSSKSSLNFIADYASDYSPVSSSDDDIQPDSSDWEEQGSSLQSDLAQFVVESQLTRESCNKLLGLLRKHGCQLAKDKRTLVKTPRSFNVSEKCGGQYVYFGL